MAAVSLIYEMNCHLSGEPEAPPRPRRGWLGALALPAPDPAAAPPAAPQLYASVWAAAGPLGPEDDYLEVARKVAGPLPQEEALAAVAALRAVLEAAGVQVTEETVTDD